MTLGSLFDGSGGFPLAGAINGITPVWAAEIAPYPIAVTRSRFPDMLRLGDIGKVNGAGIPPVDIITFGSPCQGLSVAGLRKGLQDERSGLFMEAIRIIKEMRGATNGRYPAFIFWENVPGAYSSAKGEDFRKVLEEICRVADNTVSVPRPPKGKWLRAGEIVGDNYSLAWRTVNAQYWGVPQRRRRIHLVADFRGYCASEILFNPESLPRNPAQSRGALKGAAAAAERSAGVSGGALRNADRVCKTDVGGEESCVTVWPDTARTLTARQDSSPCVDRGANIVSGFSGGKGAPYGLYENHGQDSRISGPLDTAPAISQKFGTGGNNTPLIMAHGQANAEILENLSPALNCNHEQPLIAGLDCRNGRENGNLCGTLQAKPSGGQSLNCIHPVRIGNFVRRLTPIECARLQGFPDWWGEPEPKTDFTGEEFRFWQEVRDTYARVSGKQSKRYTKAALLKWYGKLHTDSAEYRMWGNGIALPPAVYVLQNIKKVLERENQQ